MTKQPQNKEKFHHRSSLKQQNKPFKGTLKSASKKFGRQAPKPKSTSSSTLLNKTERKNRSKRLREITKQRLKKEQNVFQVVPKLVVCVPLSENASIEGLDLEGIKKTQLQIVQAKTEMSPLQVLANINSADICALIVDARDQGQITRWGNQILSLMKCQGMPSVVLLIQDHSLACDNRSQLKATWNGPLDKNEQPSCFILPLEHKELGRWLATTITQPPIWRTNRSYLVVDKVQTQNERLLISGFVRGNKWKAFQKAHITAYGDIDCRILDPQLDHEMSQQQNGDNEEFVNVFKSFSCEKPSVDVDHIESKPKKVVKVSEGTSSYQAHWLLENQTKESDTNQDLEQSEDESDQEHSDLDEKEYSEIQDCDMEQSDVDDDQSSFNERILRLIPDAVPTPKDSLVCQRYMHYKGIDNLKDACWQQDDQDRIPGYMGHVSQFADAKASHKSAISTQNQAEMDVGQYITIEVFNCQSEIRSGMVLWALFKYEDKPAMLNFLIKPVLFENTASLLAGQNKQPVHVLVDGFRLYYTSPLYSEHTTNSIHRRLVSGLWSSSGQQHQQIVASFFGPMCFAPTPILVFDPQSSELIATGGLYNTDSTRVILKRITLIGYPFRIHRRTTTIRGLFNSPQDALYYRPVQLYTIKRGSKSLGSTPRIRGHITESLGEHGKCKASFEKQISADDLLCLSLYKRVWPRWETHI